MFGTNTCFFSQQLFSEMRTARLRKYSLLFDIQVIVRRDKFL